MHTFNIREAKIHLARLVEKASKGESFLIAKDGKPLVQVTAVKAPKSPKRIGFMLDEIRVPVDFDQMGTEMD